VSRLIPKDREACAVIKRHDELPDLVTPDEARAFLRVGRNTVYDLIKSGALPSVRFGKLIRVPKAALLPNGNGAVRQRR
jgi:excisionase family DNA binding protein